MIVVEAEKSASIWYIKKEREINALGNTLEISLLISGLLPRETYLPMPFWHLPNKAHEPEGKEEKVGRYYGCGFGRNRQIRFRCKCGNDVLAFRVHRDLCPVCLAAVTPLTPDLKRIIQGGPVPYSNSASGGTSFLLSSFQFSRIML